MTFRINQGCRVRCVTSWLSPCGLTESWVWPYYNCGVWWEVTQWEVTGKRGRVLCQVPDSVMALSSCHLKYLDKAHSLVRSLLPHLGYEGLSEAIFCFFRLKHYSPLPITYAHVPSANPWTTRQEENKCYHICEESDQKGLWTGTVSEEICRKKLTHVLLHTGRISLRLVWPKLTFLFGDRVSWVKW